MRNGETHLKTFNYYILERERRKYSQKVRKLVSIDGDIYSLQLGDNVKAFHIDELLGIPSFIKGDVLINSDISELIDDRFITLGGNHKYTKVLRMSDCMQLSLPNIEFKKIGNIYENI